MLAEVGLALQERARELQERLDVGEVRDHAERDADRTGPVDVLRVGHHGSKTSSTSTALNRWSPEVAIFSLGTDNAHCHPDQGVLDRVAVASRSVWSTGAGVVEDVSRCTAATSWPANAHAGEGDVVLDVSALGTLTMQGAPL